MGFFSTKSTLVSSVLYNMAGDEIDRPSYLKTLVVGAVLGDDRTSLGSTIKRGYLDGPGIRLRRFFNWAVEHYDEIGVPGSTFGSISTADMATVEGQIPGATGKTVRVQRLDTGPFEYSYWAEQRILDVHPEKLELNWSSDIDEVTGLITLFEDGVAFDTFTPAIDKNAQYIYAIYSLVDDTTDDWGDAYLFIYKIGSGNTVLDALDIGDSGAEVGGYLPFIPLRVDNQFLSTSYRPEAYAASKKAYRRSIGGNYDKLIDSVADNPDLAEIDYAYVCFGVPLNVLENASREYLFRFFEKCRLNQLTSEAGFTSEQAAMADYEASLATWTEWKLAQDDILDPLYGTPEPTRLPQPATSVSSVKIKSSGTTDTNLDMTISWGAITKTSGTGLKKLDAYVNEVWLEVGTAGAATPTKIFTGGASVETSSGEPIQPIMIHRQVTDDSWETLTIYNMYHKNLIYRKKAVVISASEAILDTDISGFLVPLHYLTVRDMRLVDATQMMTAASYIVFNSYKVVKKKWYQTGIFKIVLFVVMIAVIIVSFGSAAAIAPGVLGTAGAVGGALGLTGLAAIIAGTVLNSLAAMIIAQLIMMGSTAIFGEKWGQLIGTVLSVLVISAGSAFASNISTAEMFRSLTSAAGLMSLTNAVGTGVAGFVAASSAEIMQKTQDLIDQTNRQLQNMAEQFAVEFGYGRAELNPMGSTDTIFGNFVESEEMFLTRTLLTGSDIAEMTHDIISNFASYTLKLDLRPV